METSLQQFSKTAPQIYQLLIQPYVLFKYSYSFTTPEIKKKSCVPCRSVSRPFFPPRRRPGCSAAMSVSLSRRQVRLLSHQSGSPPSGTHPCCYRWCVSCRRFLIRVAGGSVSLLPGRLFLSQVAAAAGTRL